MAENALPVDRLREILRKISEELGRSLVGIGDGFDWSDRILPDLRVDAKDITVAALHLRDLGLAYDALRLKAAWDECFNRCTDEWFAQATAHVSSEERATWIKLVGKFPESVDPSDSDVVLRRMILAGTIGALRRLVDELNETVTRSMAQGKDKVIDTTAWPPAPVETGRGASSGAQGRRRKTRKKRSDAKADKRIADAWRTGQYKTEAALAKQLKLTKREVYLARQRHRKREAAKGKARRE